MTDTGQVPGEGLPENAGMVEQPGVSAPGAYTFLDPSENPAEDDDLLLMPGAQGAWGNEVAPPPPQPLVEEQPLVHEPGPHETAGRDSGSLDLSGVRVPGPAATPQPTAPRRPLHLGPPTPDGSASPVRSLADRGPAAAPMATPMNPVTPPTPVRHAGPRPPVPSTSTYRSSPRSRRRARCRGERRRWVPRGRQQKRSSRRPSRVPRPERSPRR
ncbi:hypothetical protein [Streptomyces mirabilis]|uniref:hypothetical protein n=1 Tax=Streptomyces mirabilis TaxID=68239 RepID=UPI003F4CC3F0